MHKMIQVNCRHCGTHSSIRPPERVLYFAGEGFADSFYNWRCDCGGLNHRNVNRIHNFADMSELFAFGPAEYRPMVTSAQVDSEVAEICERDNACHPPISMDDVLDFMLSCDRHYDFTRDGYRLAEAAESASDLAHGKA